MFTRQLSKTLLRRTSTHLTYHATVSSTRCFGAAARKPNVIETTTESADLIRDYIKGLMEKDESDELILKPITDDELDHGFQHFQALFDEANACIADCEEASAESLEEEGKVASQAVDQAFAAYIDLLEDLRRADSTQQEYYRDAREQNATRLKLLRQQLDGVTKRS